MREATVLPVHMRAKKAAEYLGVSISTLWRWSSEGRLPRPIRLSSRCSVWPQEALDAFLKQQAMTSGREVA